MATTSNNAEKLEIIIGFLELLHDKDTKLTRYKAFVNTTESAYIAEKTIFIRNTQKLREVLLNYECCEAYISETIINPPEQLIETQKELYNLLQIEEKETINPFTEKDKIISFIKPSLSPQSSVHTYIYIYKILTPILPPQTPRAI